MENNNNQSKFDDFSVNEGTKSQLSGIAQWANLNAIFGLATLALSIIATIIAAATYGSTSGIFGLIITASISLLLNITLFQAAASLKKGVATPDQGFFEQGIYKLSSYFKITGILTIIGLVIMVLVFLVALMAGVGSTF